MFNGYLKGKNMTKWKNYFFYSKMKLKKQKYTTKANSQINFEETRLYETKILNNNST